MINYLILTVWVISSGFASTFAQLNVKDGTLCETRMYHQEFADDRSKYYMCKTHLPKQKIGVWELASCPSGTQFVMLSQSCESKKKVRRQQPWWGPQQQSCSVQPGPPQIGQNCNWPTAGLQPVPYSNQQFFQCTPLTIGSQCGQWQQQGCPPGTIFNPQLQICTTNTGTNVCPPQQTAICSCQQQQQQLPYQNQCPPTTICIQATCCQQPQPYYTPPPLPPTPPPLQQCCCCFAAVSCPCGNYKRMPASLPHSDGQISEFERSYQAALLADKTERTKNNNKQFTLVIEKQPEEDEEDFHKVDENFTEEMIEKESQLLR